MIARIIGLLFKPSNDSQYEAGFNYAAGRLLKFEHIGSIQADANKYSNDDPFDHGVRDALRNFEKMVNSFKSVEKE